MFPAIDNIEDVSKLLSLYGDTASSCIVYLPNGSVNVAYPSLGAPLPNQQKVCKFIKADQSMCGVGGHTSRSHNNNMTTSMRVLTQAVWLLESMHIMTQAEVINK